MKSRLPHFHYFTPIVIITDRRENACSCSGGRKELINQVQINKLAIMSS